MGNSWPFIEAQALLEHTKDKDEVVFACGYGPSGLPHIGTFSEVARTTIVRNAFRTLSDKPTRLIVFSDDMDALRKIPENVPNQEMLQKFIGTPLTSVPDPFGKYESFAHHNNAMLCRFLDQYGFDYEFMSATQCYQSGIFNDTLVLIARHLEQVKALVTRGYKAERIKSYCPFLPIHKGKVHQDVFDWVVHPDGLPEPFLNWMMNERSESFPGPDDRIQAITPIINGNVKCQWKVDWPMRWVALGVDYEMHGKDLIDSAQIGQRICKLLGQRAPINFMYELFLDETGEKISKSRGNGLNIEDWWRYATNEVLTYYMFANPRKARKLHFDVIPKATDEYLRTLKEYHAHPDKDNPAWHVHNGDVPYDGTPVSFGMLLNLVSITNTTDPVLIRQYVQTYCPEAIDTSFPLLDAFIVRAINFYTDRVLPFKVYRDPTSNEVKALTALRDAIRDSDPTEEAITIAIYDIGKEFYGKKELRFFFQMIYEVLMGQQSGPRFPVFTMLYGIDNTLRAIEEKI